MAWRYCRDRGRAEELAQEALVRAWRGLVHSQRDEQLRRAVLALPMLYREPVLLFYFHEMDVSRVASTLKLPEGTIKARLARGRELLRRRFPSLSPAQIDSSSATMQRAMIEKTGGAQ